MANAYTQLLIQLVFAVKNREAQIHETIRLDVEKYIAGIIKNKEHTLLAQYCMPNHCHIFVGMNPKQSISELVKDIKANSSKSELFPGIFDHFKVLPRRAVSGSAGLFRPAQRPPNQSASLGL